MDWLHEATEQVRAPLFLSILTFALHLDESDNLNLLDQEVANLHFIEQTTSLLSHFNKRKHRRE
jgi:hypothetical protein